MTVVTEPGVYDIPDDVYFRDPVPDGSLSTSGAKVLLDCPAKFRWQQTHPQPPKRHFDLGHVAHKIVLGKGASVAVLDFKDFKTKKAQEERDAAYAVGKVPVLTADYARAQAMAEAIRAHRRANTLLNPDHGTPEQAMFWRDDETGVWRRAKLDWSRRIGGRLVVVDVKTCNSAHPDAIDKAVGNFGYCMQDDAYREAVRAVGLDDDPSFFFVFVEVEPPHLVTLVELDDDWRELGWRRNRKAIDLYAKCRANDEWPGYVSGIHESKPPRWVARELEEI
ncbi:PD-(D/E)XK nuclease-like domain-containing protein [Dactylosporangium salmoneum]|uniref:PD-(D/E)XK nuclease-like domain-containing protein n=1 Tax=Dactylosporangium salmoneum TaxID=53361 RepID=UPI0031DB6EBE